jgi:hypothetical protein
MKHIKVFENYINKYKAFLDKKGLVIDKYEDIFKYDATTYVKHLGYEGFNEEEDGVEFLTRFLNEDFPYGLRNIPDKVTLYRLLALNDVKDIDVDDFGTHYVADKNLIDSDFINTIGLEDVVGMLDMDYENTKLYIVTVELDKNQIDFIHTIHNRLLYPTENEFTTIKSPKIVIKNIEIFEYDESH